MRDLQELIDSNLPSLSRDTKPTQIRKLQRDQYEIIIDLYGRFDLTSSSIDSILEGLGLIPIDDGIFESKPRSIYRVIVEVLR